MLHDSRECGVKILINKSVKLNYHYNNPKENFLIVSKAIRKSRRILADKRALKRAIWVKKK